MPIFLVRSEYSCTIGGQVTQVSLNDLYKFYISIFCPLRLNWPENGCAVGGELIRFSLHDFNKFGSFISCLPV